MTAQEFINDLIAQYEELSTRVKQCSLNRMSFQEAVQELSSKYEVSDVSEEHRAFKVHWSHGGVNMQVCVWLSHTCMFKASPVIEMLIVSANIIIDDYTIDCFKNWRCVSDFKDDYGKYFDKHIYMVAARDLSNGGNVKYSYVYEDIDETFREARELAKRLNEQYSQCFILTLYKGYKQLTGGTMAGDETGFHTISSKSKSETLKAKRNDFDYGSEPDEYTGEDESRDRRKIFVMSMVEQYEDESSGPDIELYYSKLDVELAIKKHIDEWLQENNFTLSPDESEFRDVPLCEMYSEDNFVAVYNTEEKGDLKIAFEEFDLLL